MKPKPQPPAPPVVYDHCTICGAAKRPSTNPYCYAHSDVGK